MESKQVPVQVGDELELEIVANGREGDGIAKVDGFTVIVMKKGLQFGDTVKSKITSLGHKFAFAEPVNAEEE